MMNGKGTLRSVLLISCIIGWVAAGRVQAQYYSAFGKNRIQYKAYNWKYIQSKHFDVYYYDSKNYYLASFAAQSLEAGLQTLQNLFDYQINQRIKVIVYDSHNAFAGTNVTPLPLESQGIGGVTETIQNRITLPFMGSYADFRHTLDHELTHAVINEMFYGGSLQSQIQNGVQLDIPLWFNEGMAEFSSNGPTTFYDDFMRDATINNYLPPIPDLSGYIVYPAGESVWDYINQQYGREKIGEIFQDLLDTRSVDRAFKQALGLSLKELSKRWHDYLKKKYWPEIAKRDQLQDIATQITKGHDHFYTAPVISPQGDRIAAITFNDEGIPSIVILNAFTGKKIKTLIRGQTNVAFEELNVEDNTTPNLCWSPDGNEIALSVMSEGNDQLAIINYNTGKAQKYQFKNIDAILSASWSPDGKKIVFAGSSGSFSDIYVFNLETHKLTNVTHDILSDNDPSWGPDSKWIYFTSDRGNKVRLNTYKDTYDELLNPYLTETDIYRVQVGDSVAQRLTQTPGWSERRPLVDHNNQLFYISDQNGIDNVYVMNLNTMTSKPLTNSLQGILQMSITNDGSRMVVSALNDELPSIYEFRNPLSMAKNKPLAPNQWALRRASEPEYVRIPTFAHAYAMFGSMNNRPSLAERTVQPGPDVPLALADTMGQAAAKARKNKVAKAKADTTKKKTQTIDFRNYQFGVPIDSVVSKSEQPVNVFKPEANTTPDGRYQPKTYRLHFAPDITYFGGGLDTYYGAYGLLQLVFSDVLGNYTFGLASDLQFDLRNSDYMLSFMNDKGRNDYSFNYFHYAIQFQDYAGDVIRYRNYGGGFDYVHPFNRFSRIDYNASVIGISRDFSNIIVNSANNLTSVFFYPQITWITDKTKPGFLTANGGYQFYLNVSGSPPITHKTVRFASIDGDFRKYIGLGSRYSFALRLTGGASFGPDAQTYFMGGMSGWINYQFSPNQISASNLADIFLTQPAIPMRGYQFNALYGTRFGLANIEFRFPLFAAILPGPIPFLPLYNLTGVMFTDIGTAWGVNNPNVPFNASSFHFKVAQPYQTPNGTFLNGNVLIGAGFGLRTIFLGLPLRWDIGWPYYGHHFGHHPINYISIGIDF